MDFVAIDVETANANMASICQIGLVKYENGLLVDEWKSYVDPEDSFDGINILIHGIDENIVKGSPTFSQLTDTLYSYLEDAVVVCHTHFDRVAVKQAAQRYGVMEPNCTWLDSARVVRRTWAECAWRGYGLKKVCKMLGYEFRHHDALEDAKAAAFILISALNKSGFGINDWIKRVGRPINPANIVGTSSDPKRNGNPEGALFGEIIVFTGELDMPRREAANLAAELGCQVTSGVSKKTTILVVGDQDIKKLAGHNKSSKHRKAEELLKKGVNIRILGESDFKELSKLSNIEVLQYEA